MLLAGDQGDSTRDSEMFFTDHNVTIVSSESTGLATVAHLQDHLPEDAWIKITIHKFTITLDKLDGTEPMAYFSNGLPTFESDLYLGMNRVIHDVTGQPERTGFGLCDVCVQWITN